MQYFLDDSPLNVEVHPSTQFFAGGDYCLSEVSHDPTLNCDWYDVGYKVQSFEQSLKHQDLVSAIEYIVKLKLQSIFRDKSFSGFTLNKYHQFVGEEEHRNSADAILKRLYVHDLPEIANIFSDFISDMIGMPMGFERSSDGSEHWIILRINPPYSLAYNPPHKDVYEDYDLKGRCPRMVNAWIPIAGVNQFAGLGLAPSSHHLTEAQIIRSKAGSEMNGRKFSVNMIKSWNNSNKLINIYPHNGQMLCFSSHLVHGLGVNRNSDETRIALEFRLHSK